MRHPEVVAFDVVETLFSLESLRGRLGDAGLPPHALEAWFAALLRDAFALEATGIYRPFREVASSSLQEQLAKAGQPIDLDRVNNVLAGFAELEPHPDVGAAMQTLRDAGVRVVTLTNGSADVTRKLLAKAGIEDLVERVVTIDEVKHWKPHPDVYLHCASAVEAGPAALALVAAHGWDIHGAGRAGLITGYVARHGEPFPATMRSPDVTGASLSDVAGKLLSSPLPAAAGDRASDDT